MRPSTSVARTGVTIQARIAAGLFLVGLVPATFGQSTQPVRWQAQYTQIYSDDVETTGPALTPAFSFGSAGSFTSNSTEVIAGNQSVKGSYSGTNTFITFLQTKPSILPLAPNHSYQVTFQYKILTAAANGFQGFLNSSTALSHGVGGIAGVLINGAAGKQGAATFTATTGPYADYAILWGINGAGAISIDNILISDAATTIVIASENAEGAAPTLQSGIQLQGATTLVTDPSLVISGKASVWLNNQGGLVTNPSVIPMGANTVYTIKFDYRLLSPGSGTDVFGICLQPVGTTDPQLQVCAPNMLKNAELAGTFSTGVQTGSASSYFLQLNLATPGASLVIDNIVLYRQDLTTQNAPPPTWNRLLTLPFPRLGNYMYEGTQAMAQYGWDERPFTYTVAQIENGLAFADLIAGLSPKNQTLDPDSLHRIRALNPNVVILTDKEIWEQEARVAPCCSNIDLDYQLLQSTPDAWKAVDTTGNTIGPSGYYPGILYMDISDFVPAVNGQTWRTALPGFLNTRIFPSGLWDGVWMPDVQDALDVGFPNAGNPALFNYDWNRNGLRDETPASTSDMIRAAKTKMLQQINSNANGLQLLMGNAGSGPELALDPMLNGYTFECFNGAWNQLGAPPASSSAANWRVAFDGYLGMQSMLRQPQLNILEGCGFGNPPIVDFSTPYITPTSDDFQKHRLTMGTALLGNGFYEYDLKDALSAPYWFDEYSVDSHGNAIEDRAKKGYLGQALTDAVELTNPGTLVFQEDFDSGSLPNSFAGVPSNAVSITQTPGEVISGAGSLVLSNQDHTKQGQVVAVTNPAVVPLSPGATYLLTFDWRVLETIDWPHAGFSVNVGASSTLDVAFVPGTVAGDSGTFRFPFTILAAGKWQAGIAIGGGGGKVAIDNFKIYQGGVGPWRRDFENGFVLVNPLQQPHTFSAADLKGALNRTGIHRINGTQAPDVNNGQPVTGDLTLGPFDSIILLADRIPLGNPPTSNTRIAPVSVSPSSGTGTAAAQTFTFTFFDTAGYQNLSVVNVLINQALDGRRACYVAFAPSGASDGSLFLVDDAGDAGGPYQGTILPGNNSISNTQCSINAANSWVSGNGNTLTLALAVTFNPTFGGNKIFYTAAQDKSSLSSGWQALGTWSVPTTPPAGPWVSGMSPPRANSLGPATYTFTFTDTNGWQDISVANILINSAIDGRHACYLAVVPSTHSVLLVDDPGDAGGPYAGMVLPGAGGITNSQCSVTAAGSSISGSGNTLTITLNMTFSQSFAGNQVFFLAARSGAANSNWQPLGSVSLP